MNFSCRSAVKQPVVLGTYLVTFRAKPDSTSLAASSQLQIGYKYWLQVAKSCLWAARAPLFDKGRKFEAKLISSAQCYYDYSTVRNWTNIAFG